MFPYGGFIYTFHDDTSKPVVVHISKGANTTHQRLMTSDEQSELHNVFTIGECEDVLDFSLLPVPAKTYNLGGDKGVG